MSNPNPVKTGKLVGIGRHSLGAASYVYFRCVDCGTEYPCTKKNGLPRCNGAAIRRCPFCRPQATRP